MGLRHGEDQIVEPLNTVLLGDEPKFSGDDIERSNRLRDLVQQDSASFWRHRNVGQPNVDFS